MLILWQVIHGGLHPRHILVSKNLEVKIIDYGFLQFKEFPDIGVWKSLYSIIKYYQANPEEAKYIAPELLQINPCYSFASDVYLSLSTLNCAFTSEDMRLEVFYWHYSKTSALLMVGFLIVATLRT